MNFFLYLFRVIKQNRSGFILYAFYRFVLLVATILQPVLLALIIDQLIQKPRFSTIYPYLTGYGVLATIKTIVGYLQVRYNEFFMKELQLRSIQDMLTHLESLEYAEVRRFDATYLANRIFSDIASLMRFLLSGASELFFKTILLTAYLFIIFYKDGYIFSMIFFSMIVYLWFFRLYQFPLFKNELKLKEESNLLTTGIKSRIQCIKFTKTHEKIYGGESITSKSFMNYLKIVRIWLRYFAKISFVNLALNHLVLTTVIFYCVYRIINQTLSIGNLQLIINYTASSMGTLGFISSFFQRLPGAKASYSRLTELLELKQEKAIGHKLSSFSHIKLQQVTFSLQKDQPVFINKDFHFVKNKIYALTGKSGVGKSSFFDLLQGFYPINHGNIRFDELYAEEINFPFLRVQGTSRLEQMSELNSTILSIFMNNKIIHEKIRFFMKILEIDMLYKRDDFQVSKLSGGERQRFLLAFELSLTKKLLLLDEPTSFLDEFYTKKFINLLDLVKKDRIIIIATHSSQIIEKAHEVIKLEKR